MTNVWERVATAHSVMSSPIKIDVDYIKNGIIVSACAFLILACFDRLVARRFKRSYFALHVFANIIISALCWVPAMSALLNPAASTVPAPGKASSAVFMCWVYALHIYHPIFFKTTTMDWVHHVPVYILNSLMFSVRCGDAISLKCLILCGVPGGIDYLWQVLEGEGQLDRGKYKDWCASINMWMRVPLGCISGYVILLGLYQQWDDASRHEVVIAMLMGVHAIWNVHFFGRQAVEANVVDIINRFGLAAGDIKLPKVRALSGKKATSKGQPKQGKDADSAQKQAYPVDGETAAVAPPTAKKAA